jgi:hypothetical protein
LTQIQKTTATSLHGERMGDQEFASPDCPIVNDVDLDAMHDSAWTMQPAGLKTAPVMGHENISQ